MKIILSALLVCVLGAAWLFMERLPFSNEITAYPIICLGQIADGGCKGEVGAGERTTYKIFVEQQSVVFWMESDREVRRYPYCAVRDVDNWTCQYDEPNVELQAKDVAIDGRVRFVGGRFSVDNGFGNVPKWKWWRAKLFKY